MDRAECETAVERVNLKGSTLDTMLEQHWKQRQGASVVHCPTAVTTRCIAKQLCPDERLTRPKTIETTLNSTTEAYVSLRLGVKEEPSSIASRPATSF